MTVPNVIRIPSREESARNSEKTVQNPEQTKKLRVAAYCRVSTDKTAQLESLENQVAAFRHNLSRHEDWELAGVYADEGRSGTRVEGRPEFQRMIADCKTGRIDYILVKSISRFARNTLDCVGLVRELQRYGVQVYFEKENIDTAQITSEMLLVIMASFAQEESRSISENVKWGIRKRFEAGKEMRVPIYGYRHTEHTLYQIVPDEAEIVREIFNRYVHGETPTMIVADMNRRQVPPPAGDCWKLLQISRMLHNEKYVGDVILQKHYVESHLTHREVRNNGALPKFYMKDSHAPLIDRHVFEQAQQILSMRQLKTGNSSYPYGNRLKCPRCGNTLTHGSLYSVTFGGERILKGGWGCYGPEGCREYLLIQNILDRALICAYAHKYGVQMDTVEYYWMDDSINDMILKENAEVTIHWKDGTYSHEPLTISHAQLEPRNSAKRYNQFLESVRIGKTKVKSKFLMGR